MDFLNVLAHEGEEVVEEIAEVIGPTLDQVIRANSMKFSLIAGGVLLFLTLVSILIKQKKEVLKYLLFGLIVVTVLSNSVYLIGSTVYLNKQSTTGGPVHWHADFEIWNCGQLVELKNPHGLSNKIGSETVHEHNDQRIHIEGVILERHHASLYHFFEVIGGKMTDDSLTIPTEDGLVTLQNGQNCPEGESKLQVFVYKTEGDAYYQEKLSHPADYVISPHSQVPPGDCIIIELDRPKNKTEKICTFYKQALEKGKIHEP